MQTQSTAGHINSELGSGIDQDRQAFDALVKRIKSFHFDGADLADAARVIEAAKLVSEEAVRRYQHAIELEDAAKAKLATAELAVSVGEVVKVHRSSPFLSKLGFR